MIIDVEASEAGFILTLRRKGGDTVLLTVPRDTLFDRERLQRLAMQHGVRLRLNKYDRETWRGVLRVRYGIE
jgi:hypothetical protein